MKFDYVITGAGSAGCVLANRLSEDPSVTVCVIEAGAPDTSALISAPAGLALLGPLKLHMWGFETIAQAGLGGRRGYQPRGKVLGGSSSTNAMIYLRGHSLDYEGWRDQGAPGWGWDNVLPYFIRAEHNERGAADAHAALHGRSGPLNVADLRSPNAIAQKLMAAAREAGYPLTADFNTGDTEGFGAYQVTQKCGERWSAARAYLHPAMARPNVTVITGAMTKRIVFEKGDDAGAGDAGGDVGSGASASAAGRAGLPRATGIEFERDGRVETAFAAREVLVCAGAFQSPQLLMCSGIGPGAHLAERGITPVVESPGVGQNLQDHIDYIINRRHHSLDLFGMSPGGLWRIVQEIRRYRRERRGMVTSNYAETGGFIKTLPDLAKPDVQFHFVIGMVDNHNRTRHAGHGYSLHACVLNPKSVGEVRLASADMRDAPLIDPRFLSHADDVATLKRGFAVMRKILNAPAFAPHLGPELYTQDLRDDDDAGLEAAIRARADTIYHPVGTCRMGTDALAVVDPQLRVRGVAGLRVVDASVMPAVPSGNTNAPTIMIAERAADLIKGAVRSVDAGAARLPMATD